LMKIFCSWKVDYHQTVYTKDTLTSWDKVYKLCKSKEYAYNITVYSKTSMHRFSGGWKTKTIHRGKQ
jgi:hypothetical protein